MRGFLISIFIVVSYLQVSAQIPVPASEQLEGFLFVNATAHLGNGKVIEDAAFGIVGGKISLIDENSAEFRMLFSNIVDLKGKHIYPGFINARSNLGLAETSSIRSTRDDKEIGDFRPHIYTAKAYNADNIVIPTVRSNGVLLSNVTGSGGVITNTSAVMHADAWNWEDALVKDDIGIWLNWPEKVTWSSKEVKYTASKTYDEEVKNIKEFFEEAKMYADTRGSAGTNLKYEAMTKIFGDGKRTFVVANFSKEILDAINTLKEVGVKDIVLVEAAEAYKQTAFLKQNEIPVMLGELKALPNSEDDDLKIVAKQAKILQDEGILFCVYRDNFWDSRNLPFSAGIGVTYGLTKEEALSAITGNAAKIIGIDDIVGTLEVGKDATVLITDGDPLDYLTHKIEKAFIQGREIDLDNHHKQLDAKFSRKLGQ
ncbi:MAG: amidohydrolase family protein [Flavobacteriales bacterium]|nr:amidohydrolase family protein [Flavobacteriales bacterium]